MRLEDGDAFEHTYCQWLRENLPTYEALWAAFIGHGGDGWPLSIFGLNEDEDKRRKKLFQAHYTAAIECFHLDQEWRAIHASAGEIRDLNTFLDLHRRLADFIARIGRVRDMYKLMDEAMQLGGSAYQPLQEFYALRSHVLHGPRMPGKEKSGLLMIPKVARQNKRSDEWDDKSYWDDFRDVEYVYMSDFCDRTRDEFFRLVLKMHERVYAGACVFFGDRRVVTRAPAGLAYISGFTTFPAVSAFRIPPSGMH